VIILLGAWSATRLPGRREDEEAGVAADAGARATRRP
jgi:hypothetical protein